MYELRNLNSNAIIYTGGLNVFTTAYLSGTSVKIPDLFFKIIKINNEAIVLFLFVNEPDINQMLQLSSGNNCQYTGRNKKGHMFYFTAVDNFRGCFNDNQEFTWPQELSNLGYLSALEFRNSA